MKTLAMVASPRFMELQSRANEVRARLRETHPLSRENRRLEMLLFGILNEQWGEA